MAATLGIIESRFGTGEWPVVLFLKIAMLSALFHCPSHVRRDTVTLFEVNNVCLQGARIFGEGKFSTWREILGSGEQGRGNWSSPRSLSESRADRQESPPREEGFFSEGEKRVTCLPACLPACLFVALAVHFKSFGGEREKKKREICQIACRS